QPGHRHREQRALGGDRGQGVGAGHAEEGAGHGQQHARPLARQRVDSPRAPTAGRAGGTPRGGGMAATAAAPHTQARRLGGERMKEARVAYSSIAAPMVVYGLLFFYPIVYSIYISRYDWGVLGKNEYLGWSNYHELLHDERFHIAIENGLKFTIAFT